MLAWVSVPGSWRQQHRRLLLRLCVLFAVVWSSLVDKRLGGGSTLACCCWSPLSPLACCGQRRSAAVYHHRARAVCPLLLLLPLPGLSPVDCVALKHGPGRSARYIPTALLLPRTSATCVTPPETNICARRPCCCTCLRDVYDAFLPLGCFEHMCSNVTRTT